MSQENKRTPHPKEEKQYGTLLLEKAKNGYIVNLEPNFLDRMPVAPSVDGVMVFETEEALTKFIKTNFKIEHR